MHRQIIRLIDDQASWAKPVGQTVQGWLGTVFGATPPSKDLLNGIWLGHPLHPMLTDVPVGALTAATLLDLTGKRRAADLATATGVAGMLASAASGAADAVDTYGREQVQATVHASIMVGSLGAYAASLWMRLVGRSRVLAVLLSLAGYGALAAGAYVGGDLVFRSGNGVDRHAWDSPGKKWRRLDVTEVPEQSLVRAMAGKVPLVLYRTGERISALNATCSHAGGPLDEGTIVDGCVECPWHQSQYRLADGRLVHGPSVYDQPAWEVRAAEGGGFEARPRPPLVG